MIAPYLAISARDVAILDSTILQPHSVGDVSQTCFPNRGETTSHVSRIRVPQPQAIGNYELLGELGRGGMGVVFRARNLRLNRIVALKTLLPAPFPSESAADALRLEARIGASFDHPSLVTVQDMGERNGRPYFCMDYIEGESLASRLKCGALHPRAAARVVAETAEAVQYVHDQGYLHRDVKPGNILLDRTGHARLIDFGLAQRVGCDQANLAPGSIAGTPNYMSPEQATGQHELMGPASDVYSLGTVLYELLTGRRPFIGDGEWDVVRVGRAFELQPRSAMRGVSAELESICFRAMQNSAEARYATATEMARDLRRFSNCLN